jgi:hypothetical protein
MEAYARLTCCILALSSLETRCNLPGPKKLVFQNLAPIPVPGPPESGHLLPAFQVEPKDVSLVCNYKPQESLVEP